MSIHFLLKIVTLVLDIVFALLRLLRTRTMQSKTGFCHQSYSERRPLHCPSRGTCERKRREKITRFGRRLLAPVVKATNLAVIT